ncbi:MAG: hypothetical protein WCH10_02010 [bacterium]
MLLKQFKLCLCVCFFLLSLPSQALEFHYDNYSRVPSLKYSFTFDGYNWLSNNNELLLDQQEFRTIEFGSLAPLAWKVDAPSGKKIHCFDLFDQQKNEVKNIVTLKDAKFAERDDLLLDVIDDGASGILVSIISADGDRIYSNAISCSIDRENFR